MATNENYYTILTSYGKQKLAEAQASGTSINLTEFAVGDGNGSYYAPNETQTALVNEVYRAQINRITTDSANPNWIIVEGIIPADQGGFTIREIGIFDDQNKLIAIGNYPETYKPILSQGAGNDMYIRFIMEVENVDSVQLKIDPAIVLASRKYVDDEISTHSADETSHNIPGQISTAINSHNTDTYAHTDIRNLITDLQNNKVSIDLSNITSLGNILNLDGAGSGLDADLVRGLPADFTSSLTSSGYQKLPSGLIIQWGIIENASSPDGTYTVTLPITFPNQILIAVASIHQAAAGNNAEVCGISSLSSSSIAIHAWITAGPTPITTIPQGTPIYWLAVGY